MCVSGVAPLILLKWSMFQTKLLEKTYLHVMPNAVFFLLALHMKLLNSQHRFSTCTCEDCWSFLFFMIIKWDFLSTDIKILVYISECILFQLNLARLLKYLGVCGGAVGWGTTSRKFVGSIPDAVMGIFHWHNPSGHTVALGLTQPLTEMITRSISWG